MNNQQAFNSVWDYFIILRRAPGARSNGECCYITPTGKRCAIGCLVSETEALRMQNFNGVTGISEQECVPKVLQDCDISFLDSLQGAHDSSVGLAMFGDFHEAMKRKLTDLAERFNLKVPSGS